MIATFPATRQTQVVDLECIVWVRRLMVDPCVRILIALHAVLFAEQPVPTLLPILLPVFC